VCCAFGFGGQHGELWWSTDGSSGFGCRGAGILGAAGPPTAHSALDVAAIPDHPALRRWHQSKVVAAELESTNRWRRRFLKDRIEGLLERGSARPEADDQRRSGCRCCRAHAAFDASECDALSIRLMARCAG